MEDRKPNLAQMISATRQGFGWSSKHQSFIRISYIAGDAPPFKIEITPPDDLPRGGGGERYVRWREWDNAEEMLNSIATLSGCRPNKMFVFYVNEDGSFIESESDRRLRLYPHFGMEDK